MGKLNELLSIMISKLNASVKTEAQDLTEEQKAQARKNIGAMPANAVISLTSEQINALDALFKAASYVKDVSVEYAAFCDAFSLVSPDDPPEDAVVPSIKKGSVSFENGLMGLSGQLDSRATLVPIGRYLEKGKTYRFSLGNIATKYYYGVQILVAESAGMEFPYVPDTITNYSGVTERIIDTGWMTTDYTYTPDTDNCILAVNFKSNPVAALNDSNYAEILENFVFEENV